jgi:regulatory factor X 4
MRNPSAAESEALELMQHDQLANMSMPAGGHLPRLRPHSTPATLCWLEKNYELSEGVCIPRNVVYFNYVDFCNKNGMQPVNAASFGKVCLQLIRSIFNFNLINNWLLIFRLLDKCFKA